MSHPDVPKSLCIFTDCSEIVPEILSDIVMKKLRECKDSFISMHFSDQMATETTFGPQKPARKELRFEFKCPDDPMAMHKIEQLMQMSLHLIDRVARLKLPSATKAKARGKRDAMHESDVKAQHQARQELAQKKKMDKIAEQKKLKESLSPEALRKLEQKEYQQSLKKRQPKMKLSRA